MTDNTLGWKCPDCGKCWSPWIDSCNCYMPYSIQLVMCPVCNAYYRVGDWHKCVDYSGVTTAGGTTTENE